MVETNCPFCQTVGNPDSDELIYHDEHVIAVLRNDHVEGHVLIIPCQHVQTLLDLPSHAATGLMRLAALLSAAIRTVTEADGLALWQADPNSTQPDDTFHFHLHLVPRYAGDGRMIFLATEGIDGVNPHEVEPLVAWLRDHLRDTPQGGIPRLLLRGVGKSRS
ncbi:MAG: HIT family protein [Anaerolineae bacterium]|nr:HIT family protein [Anaerolineae bacterium]